MDHPSVSIRASTSMQRQAKLRHSPPANLPGAAVATLLRRVMQRTTEAERIGADEKSRWRTTRFAPGNQGWPGISYSADSATAGWGDLCSSWVRGDGFTPKVIWSSSGWKARMDYGRYSV